jgi:hypothetical protein
MLVVACFRGNQRLKGKCALGPFLSILVIKCLHKCLSVNLCKVVDKVQIKSKGMFLDLVHCFIQPKSAQSGCTGLSGGAPDSVRCARLALAN